MPRSPRRPWTPEEGVTVFRMRAAGATPAEISAAVGRSHRAIREAVSRLRGKGIPIPPHRNGRPELPVPPEAAARARALRAQNWSLSRISAHVGCGEHVVRRLLDLPR